MSYGVVIHDYMLDMMNREFTFVFGDTADIAINEAYNMLKESASDKLMYGDEISVTKKNFTKRMHDTLNSVDGLYITEPHDIYVSLFKVPEKGE